MCFRDQNKAAATQTKIAIVYSTFAQHKFYSHYQIFIYESVNSTYLLYINETLLNN